MTERADDVTPTAVNEDPSRPYPGFRGSAAIASWTPTGGEKRTLGLRAMSVEVTALPLACVVARRGSFVGPRRRRPMLRTLSIVISIALADSVNASTIGPALVLASGEHPRRSVLEFAVGVIAVFFLGGALIVLGPGRALHALEPHPSPTLRYIVETVVGLVMLVVAALLGARQRTLTRHAREGRGEAGGESEHSDDQRPDNGEQGQDEGDRSQVDGPRTQRRSPFVMGAIVGAVELPTAFPYFGAIAAIVSSRLGLARELLLVAVYDVCFVRPLFGIILVLMVGGEGATERLARIRTQFQAHCPALASGAALVAGVYVTVLGVTGLASGASGHAGRSPAGFATSSPSRRFETCRSLAGSVVAGGTR